MIRFSPDTWVDAVMRPIAMAAPNGGVYVETVAPDFRFVFVLLLLLPLLVPALRRREGGGTRPAFILLAFCALAFVPWLATSGNGRYFMSVLLLAGPLCVALLWQLRATRALRMSLLAGMIVLQLFLIQQNTPWDSWGLKPWKDGPAFAVDVPEDLRTRPATYITLSNISYSIIAYQFHPASRWVNLTTQHSDADQTPDGLRTKAFLAAAGEAYVVFPSGPGEEMHGQPPAGILEAQDDMLAGYGWQVRGGNACRLLHSEGLTNLGLHRWDAPMSAPADQRGFWFCSVERRPDGVRRGTQQPPEEIEAALNKVEQTCPRMFPPGEARTSLLPSAARRLYPSSDMRLYVFEDRQVAYKYMRALNPVSLGRIEDVLASGFRMDCNQIRGRSGLPWDREI
jgi:hypothetical protein